MSTIPWEDNEKRNYIFMDDIFTNVVSEELRKIFVREWNNRYQSKLGAWDNTNISGSQLFNLEKSRARPNKNTFQSKFHDGDTNDWDCSVLFDAILFSNSIGKKSLNPTVKTEVDNLRALRNEIKHISEGKLADADFKTMITRVENAFQSLGLTIRKIIQMKTNRSSFKSFQVLPLNPDHEVVLRSEKVHEVIEVLGRLRCDNGDKLTYFYISGNPGSGKSQLARQVCENIWNGINWQAESVFVMTLDGRDVDSLFYSYEDFCRRLNCNESVLEGILRTGRSGGL
ncbi:uncharacterized protein LOC114525910 [Dendronephthya gigantea]|uniref:uncharacterized protein LOC114525910 n=1 Tax=Dendronephthya gigantea TaxID=151771 RepID=UPI00106A722F|nr:uncharacterized protein LOC114525910 [Dendronephthya gigantea]